MYFALRLLINLSVIVFVLGACLITTFLVVYRLSILEMPRLIPPGLGAHYYGMPSSQGPTGERPAFSSNAIHPDRLLTQPSVDGVRADEPPRGVVPPSKVQELLSMLREIRVHAASLEEQVWDLDTRLKNAMREEAELRETIARKRHDVRPPSTGLGNGTPFGAPMDTAPSSTNRTAGSSPLIDENDQLSTVDQIIIQQNQNLRRRIAIMQDDRRKDQESKIRLLESVSFKLHGSHHATLADRNLTAPSLSTLPPALSTMVHVLRELPESNLDVLRRAHFFEFCNATTRAAERDVRRMGVVNLENAILTGCQAAGFQAKLVNVVSSISVEDLQKL